MVPRRPVLGCVLFLLAAGLAGAAADPRPVSPDPSPEAVALLQVLYSISGKYTLTGQHNFPNIKSRNSDFAAQYTGKTPVIWGSDFGHAKAGNSDSYLARPDIVQEAIRQSRLGSIVALCWHEVPPTADEPITFMPLPGADPKVLKSVQGKLLDQQFEDVLTPGTALYTKWCAQVDNVAGYLKQLDAAHVPVLWRPYHEMNGDWFWWGNRTGRYSTLALYRQMFDRFVNVHHLHNLIWVWSVDRPSRPGMEHAKYFPGPRYVDVLALDVYGGDFAQSYYDSLVALSQGKPIALAEVGGPPPPDVLARQPLWTYYMTWAGMVRNTSKKQYALVLSDPRVLGREDAAYSQVTAAYRQVSGLPPLHYTPPPADFSGSWVLDEDRSDLGRGGAGRAPARLEVGQHGNALTVRTTRVLEYADDETADQQLTLDGSEVQSTFMNAPVVTTATVSPDGQRLLISAVMVMSWGPTPGATMTTRDTWSLTDGGRTLTIARDSAGPRGDEKTTLVFDRR